MGKRRKKVMVIGSDPPCPRCSSLSGSVKQVAAEGNVEIDFQHCALTSPDATALGEQYGRKIGNAHHVADDASIEINWDAVHAVINKKKEEIGFSVNSADLWTPELDKLLEPCQKAADAAGYFMTPILVVDGVVKHHGSVPNMELVRTWILE